MEQNKSTTLDRIKELNPGGISDNMMIARLSRILSETKFQENSLTSDSPKDPNQQQQASSELGQLLARDNVESTRQAIKQQYLEQYLTRFGLEEKPQQSQDNQKVIAQLERFKELKTQVASTPKQSFVRDTFNRAVGSFNNQNRQTQDREQEKQPFIRAVLDAVIIKGKNLGNQIRSFTNDRYTASLSVEDTKQILSIDRNQPKANQQNPAFKAQKEGLQDFKILQNSLSDLEVKDIVADTSQPTPQPQPRQLPQPKSQHKPKNKGLELD